MSSVPAVKFSLLNLTGAAVWAVALGYGGYFFGHAFEIFLDDAKKYEFWVFSLIAVTGFLAWRISHMRPRKQASSGKTPDSGRHADST
jgi:membrane protein DedA with SNARE-associated domain